VESWN